MNLYRTFGSLLETWVTEGYPTLDLAGQPDRQAEAEVESGVDVGVEGVVPGGQVDAFKSGSRDSLQFSVATVRSESEDSGVDMVSTGSPWASHQHVMIAALEALGAGGSEGSHLGGVMTATSGEDHLPIGSSSPVLSTRSCPSSRSSSSSSSSSSCQSVGSERCSLAPGAGPPSGAKVERALQRADPARRQVPQRVLSLASRVDPATLLRKCSNASQAEGARDHKGQRSQSFKQGGETQSTGEQAVMERLDTVPGDSRLQIQQQTNTIPETSTSRLQAQVSGAAKEGWAELSPGFIYLEQVCLMLERFSQLQTHQRGIQTEIEQLRNQQNHRPPHSTQHTLPSQCLGVHITEFANQTHNTKPALREGLDILTELRRRSSSDAGRLTPCPYHRRRRSRSIGDLLEEDEEDTTVKPAWEDGEERGERKGRGPQALIQKIASLRRNEPQPDTQAMRSQTLPRLAKKSSLRSLGQFFKKRSKVASTT